MKPRLWKCPTCRRTVREPEHLLKGYDAVGHLCPNTHRWADFKPVDPKAAK